MKKDLQLIHDEMSGKIVKTAAALALSEGAGEVTARKIIRELGGKSPCIVDDTADIQLAARRIVFGKYLNCGQTCVAPDYILCEKSVRGELVNAIKREIVWQFGDNPLADPDYGRIVNQKHFDRLLGSMDPEIFGSILPVLTFDDFEEVFGLLRGRKSPWRSTFSPRTERTLPLSPRASPTAADASTTW